MLLKYKYKTSELFYTELNLYHFLMNKVDTVLMTYSMFHLNGV